MITLDPTKPEGHEVALDLVRWADVVTESFSPKGMRGMGLGYDTLSKVKPDLIMLSTCLMGQTGPLARFAGFGNLAAAISGFYELTGWADRDPAGPFGAYTDYIAPRYNAIAVLAALEHRRQTGEGQHIDLAQGEASLHFLAPALLDYTANGRVQTRAGNSDRELAPHGVYPAAGKDRWVAIAVEDDVQWRALTELLEQPDLATDRLFASAAARIQQREALDRLLVAFTEKRDRFELEALLQSRGIPASAVQNSPELVIDRQLLHRGHFVELEHPDGGTTVVEGSRIRLSRTPAAVRGPAPTFGCDNETVLKDILGYDDEKIAEIIIAGALE
jgi:crotonobetainyl-CoA:carnitine CoA-transferase CaiB-like acyl-CoA transferase